MKRLLFVVVLLLVTIFIILGSDFLSSQNGVTPEPAQLKVNTLLRRYGREETIVLKLTNDGDSELIFADNLYGMKLYKKQENGMWTQVVETREVQYFIHTILPGEHKEVHLRHNQLSDGEYRVVFEGWKKDEYHRLIKGETIFFVFPNPTFKAEALKSSVKSNESFDIIVTNDRAHPIVFSDNTMNLQLYILNEENKWMKLPSPLYNDHLSFELQTGQTYHIKVPPLRARGDYRIKLSGITKDGINVSAEVLISVR